MSSPRSTAQRSPTQPRARDGAPRAAFALPLAYRFFFLLIEPLSALAGAYYAHFAPGTYLALTDAGSAPATAAAVPLGTGIALSQLANMYLLFALNEAVVLRATSDLRVWRALLAVLLVADLGHLASVGRLGWHVYWDVRRWNAIDWGNVPFVCLGAAMRIAFLSGIGLGGSKGGLKRNV